MFGIKDKDLRDAETRKVKDFVKKELGASRFVLFSFKEEEDGWDVQTIGSNPPKEVFKKAAINLVKVLEDNKQDVFQGFAPEDLIKIIEQDEEKAQKFTKALAESIDRLLK